MFKKFSNADRQKVASRLQERLALVQIKDPRVVAFLVNEVCFLVGQSYYDGVRAGLDSVTRTVNKQKPLQVLGPEPDESKAFHFDPQDIVVISARGKK